MARRVSLLAVVGALVLAPSALAAPSVNTYGGEGGQTQAQLGGQGNSGGPINPGASASRASVASGDDGGTLPFTGLDLALMLGGGLVLVAVGAGLARLSPRAS